MGMVNILFGVVIRMFIWKQDVLNDDIVDDDEELLEK